MFDAPRQIAAVMENFASDWFVAGGWAIDLFVGRETRLHADIEIAVFRRDQTAVQKHFADWRLLKAAGGNLSAWNAGDFLELPVHAIHCFNERAEPNFLEILLNEADERNWIFRRDERITRPLAETSLTLDAGIRFLRPEIVLLYKSKNPRPKDEQDFETAVGLLGAESRAWLKNSLAITDAEHHWLKILA